MVLAGLGGVVAVLYALGKGKTPPPPPPPPPAVIPPVTQEGLPTRMKQLRVLEPNADITKVKLELQEVDLPVVEPGFVMVKMVAAPINPSDLNFLLVKESYIQYPCTWGNEGSGYVVATGGGPGTERLLGKAVGISGQRGTYAEFAVAPAYMVNELPPGMNVADGCGHFVNPWTVVQIITYAKAHGAPAIVNTGGASALGQMLVRLAAQEGVALLSVVRTGAQAAVLRSLGAEHVLVSPSTVTMDMHDEEQLAFKSQLAAKMTELGATVAFDCIGGSMTGTLLSALPYGGTLYQYGRLAPELCGGIDHTDLIYRAKSIKGLFLGAFLGELGASGTWVATKEKVLGLLATDFGTTFKDFTLDTVEEAVFTRYSRSNTNAKPRVLISP